MATQNSWNNKISDAKSQIVLNAGTNTINIGSDASANAVNVATGAAAKVVTVGSTNGASSLALKFGTSDFSLASASGTVISALDTGQVTMPLQPSFRAYLSSTATDVTGNNTEVTVIFDTEDYDIGSNYNTGTGIFVAPVTGVYSFTAAVYLQGLLSTHTLLNLWPYAGATTPVSIVCNPYAMSISGELQTLAPILIKLTAGDSVKITIKVTGGTKVVDFLGGSNYTYFSGHLVS